jgi:hypothetical protein
MQFGSYEWHLHHNYALAKQNAQIWMQSYRMNGAHFKLVAAIERTCRALKIKKQIRGMA